MTEPGIGDPVMYVPECTGDRCQHATIHDRAAIVTGPGTTADPDTVDLVVFHPDATAHVHNVRRGQPGQLRSWYPKENQP